jgi:hypothetical protein
MKYLNITKKEAATLYRACDNNTSTLAVTLWNRGIASNMCDAINKAEKLVKFINKRIKHYEIPRTLHKRSTEQTF